MFDIITDSACDFTPEMVLLSCTKCKGFFST